MYKFMVVKGSCGNPYSTQQSEDMCNQMAQQGYELVQTYQTSMAGGCGGGSARSVLVLIFRRSE